jgi:hypothetical protein
MDVKVKGKKVSNRKKPKHPTVNTSLGLPYKPPLPNSRKKKVEKKIELELDFHDPLNKILWEDGIGGLSNCNKLFGFNEFGLVEVLSKKDISAKLKQFTNETPSISDENSSKYKLRKISDPEDQFSCMVCSKLGTIRDFFSPECCSEACLAITKRKSSEYGVNTSASIKDDDSISTPTDGIKTVTFDGETITLQQLQQYLLEQQLPESQRRTDIVKKMTAISPDNKFSWDSYLTAKSVPAPAHLFKNQIPLSNNPFRVGTKIEAIDPHNQHLFCVCTVEEKLGYRIKLHFDGYPSSYDFWVNADSAKIFPIGYCKNHNRKLEAPPRLSNANFDWDEYLKHTNSVGAKNNNFARYSKLPNESENPFVVGTLLEVKRDDFWYAARIIDIIEMSILVKFEGIYERFGCQWYDINSPYLSPCDGHKQLDNPSVFMKPLGTSEKFVWSEYLRSVNAIAADVNNFKARAPHQFDSGMKLEVVDKVNPQLIRPATVLCQEEYKIQVLFDGFDINYAYWLEDDADEIFPINYCERTNHPIEAPAGFNKSYVNSSCATPGCRGVGNGLHPDRYFHELKKECPYHKENWKRLIENHDSSRLEYKPPAKR